MKKILLCILAGACLLQAEGDGSAVQPPGSLTSAPAAPMATLRDAATQTESLASTATAMPTENMYANDPFMYKRPVRTRPRARQRSYLTSGSSEGQQRTELVRKWLTIGRTALNTAVQNELEVSKLKEEVAMLQQEVQQLKRQMSRPAA